MSLAHHGLDVGQVNERENHSHADPGEGRAGLRRYRGVRDGRCWRPFRICPIDWRSSLAANRGTARGAPIRGASTRGAWASSNRPPFESGREIVFPAGFVDFRRWFVQLRDRFGLVFGLSRRLRDARSGVDRVVGHAQDLLDGREGLVRRVRHLFGLFAIWPSPHSYWVPRCQTESIAASV